MDHGLVTVILRPTLRAAMTLERLHDGWSGLFQKLEQSDTATIRQIIRTAAADRNAAEAFLRSFRNQPLSKLVAAVSAPLWALMDMFHESNDTDSDQTTPATRSPRPWADAYAEFYQIGTGWLGWTPAETWAATLPEIVQALEGQTARHIAMNGGSKDDAPASPSTSYTPERLQEIEELGHDPAFDRAGLQALKARHNA